MFSYVKHIFIFLLVFLSACGKSDFELAQEAYLAQDYEYAIEQLSPLVKKDNEKAIHLLAVIYEKGQGVEADEIKAIELFQHAADLGHAESQVKIASLYLLGKIYNKDYWEAMKWSRKAALQGNAMAQANIAYMFHDGIGVSQDYIEALKWYKKAAEQGLASAQHDLGVIFQRGSGVEKDYSIAISWYRLSANQGYLASQDALYTLYRNRIGIPSDDESFYKWILESAKQADVTAQYVLASIYLQGVLKDRNIILAYAWAGIASAGGHIFSRNLRNNLEKSMTLSMIEEARAKARELWLEYGNQSYKNESDKA